MNSVLNISVSCYPDYRSTDGKPVNLLTWLQSAKYADRVLAIRATNDKADRDKLKSFLPAITPSGLFRKREAAGLIAHSNLMQIDVDNVKDIEATKAKIISIANVAYCGLSVSGYGLWALLPIAKPEHHKEYFTLIEKALAGMGVAIDTACKDVCRLRGYSYDPNAYFNHNAKPLEKWYREPAKQKNHFKPQFSRFGIDRDQYKAEALIQEIARRKFDLTPTYRQWFELGCSLANKFGESGRNYFHSVSQFHPKYNHTETDKQFNHCLKHRYSTTIATFFGLCRDAGIMFKEIAPIAPIALSGKKQTDLTDRWRVLNDLLSEGDKDAGLFQAGLITKTEWYNRNDALQQKILQAGITLDEYTKAVKFQTKTIAA